jgi:hypothetical protein
MWSYNGKLMQEADRSQFWGIGFASINLCFLKPCLKEKHWRIAFENTVKHVTQRLNEKDKNKDMIAHKSITWEDKEGLHFKAIAVVEARLDNEALVDECQQVLLEFLPHACKGFLNAEHTYEVTGNHNSPLQKQSGNRLTDVGIFISEFLDEGPSKQSVAFTTMTVTISKDQLKNKEVRKAFKVGVAELQEKIGVIHNSNTQHEHKMKFGLRVIPKDGGGREMKLMVVATADLSGAIDKCHSVIVGSLVGGLSFVNWEDCQCRLDYPVEKLASFSSGAIEQGLGDLMSEFFGQNAAAAGSGAPE